MPVSAVREGGFTACWCTEAIQGLDTWLRWRLLRDGLAGSAVRGVTDLDTA